MKLRIIFSFLGILCLVHVFAQSAFAHVVVKPSEVAVGSRQTFTVAVPVEKEISTVAVRLVVPADLSSVMPNVKQGWKISTKKLDGGTMEILWSGGVIPTGQRDEFAFSAKVPAKETDIIWKAYQTYQDGSVVSWDKSEAEFDESDKSIGPFSTTSVIDDLTPKPTAADAANDRVNLLSIAALAMSAFAISMQLFSRKTA